MDQLKRLYAVETLDVRFGPRQGQTNLSTRPPKWQTKEFWFYYLAFLTIPPLMFKAVYDVSGPWHSGYSTYKDLLSPGWIPGRMVDNSDGQYKSFRDNIPYMALLVVLHPLLRKVYESARVCCSHHEDLKTDQVRVGRMARDQPVPLQRRVRKHVYSTISSLPSSLLWYCMASLPPRSF